MKRNANLLSCMLVFCLLIQLIDLSEFIRNYRDRFHDVGISDETRTIDFSDDLSESVKNLAVTDGESKVVDRFALFAVENGLTFNKSANARDIEPIFGETNESVRDMIENQTLRNDTIYILLNSEDQIAASEKYPDSVQITEEYAYLIIK